MSTSSLLAIAALLGASLCCPAKAAAAPSKTTPAKPTKTATAGKSPVAAMPATKKAKAATQRTAKRAADLAHDVRRRGDRIQHMLRDARSNKNGKRVRCLDDKLSQIHALERVAARESSAVRGALRKGIRNVVTWRMTRIHAVALRAAEVSDEARACGATIRRRATASSGYRVRMVRPNLPRYYDMPYWGRARRSRKHIARRR